ncbi:MAG: N-acetylmuramoyl-L-alanine amidase [Verrucomicrobiota bacterium]|nr:N-acetylmuramoyl-L-alanine amidase [Verrucomicrobiota bacterium]
MMLPKRITLITPALVALWWALSATAGAADFSRVVIDAGHGGHDRGAGFSHTYEKHLALDVARRLDLYLKAQGIQTTLTRDSDKFVTLSRRVAISHAAGNAIFISIHFNHARRRSAAGIETFYNARNAASRKLAQMVQSATLYKTRSKNRGVKHARFHVLSQNKQPAILLECAFLTNSSDRTRALDPVYRQRIVEGIAMAIIKFRATG